MKKIITLFIPVFLLVSACGKDIPDKEVTSKDDAFHMFFSSATVQASTNQLSNENVRVQHMVRGNDVYVECKVNGYSFRKDSKNKLVKLLVEINGEKKQEYHNAAFVIQDLKDGNYKIKVHVMDEESNHSIYNDSFDLTIKK